MFKSILVAIDGGPTSRRGFMQALALAKEQGATLHVLHVLDEAPVITGYEGAGYITQDYVDRLEETLRRHARKVLATAEATARKEGQTIHPVLVEARGHGVADVIVREARKLRADLIVLGTHGRRGLRRLVMGSDAESVVHETTVPVLLVRGGAVRKARGDASAASRGRTPRASRRAKKTGATGRARKV